MAYCTIIPRIKLGNPQIGLISELRFVWSNTSSLAAINPPKNELFQEPEARFILWTKQFLGPLQLQRKILVQLLLKSRISEIFWVSSITWHGPWIIALMSSDFLGKCCRCLPLDACLHHEHREIEQHEGSFAEGCHFDHIPLMFKLFRMYLCFYSCSTQLPQKALESSRFKACRYLLMFLTSISSQVHEALPNTINICPESLQGMPAKGALVSLFKSGLSCNVVLSK